MTNRTQNFIVVGLAIIIFLLGFFYMSCSSKTVELRQALGEFESRIRSLTIKNSDHEKQIELLNTNKRELQEEKINIQKQMEKKDSEINDINTKLNEKLAEVQSFKSDKQVLEEQLKQFKNMSDSLVSKDSTIEKMKQDFDEQKKSYENQLNDLKQQLNQSQNNLIISNQRFQPLLSPNETIQNSSLLAQQLSANLNNNLISIQTNNIQQVDQNRKGQEQKRSLNDSIIDNELSNKTQSVIENVQKTVNLTPVINLNETNLANNQSHSLQ